MASEEISKDNMYEIFDKAIVQVKASWHGEQAQHKEILDFFEKHVAVRSSANDHSTNIPLIQGLALPSKIAYEISIIPGRGLKHEGRQRYLQMKKSKIGMVKRGSAEVVSNEDMYRESGLGVFTNRHFRSGERIGPFLGTLKLVPSRRSGSDDVYHEHEGRLYRVLANEVYFGVQFIKKSVDRNRVNVKLVEESEISFFVATKDISIGDELYK